MNDLVVIEKIAGWEKLKALALRANIDETESEAIITEQGGPGESS